MQRIGATIFREDEEILRDIVIELDPPSPGANGVHTTWGGVFVLPSGITNQEKIDLFEKRRLRHTLLLSDGRRGEILLNVQLDDTHVGFLGTGQLK